RNRDRGPQSAGAFLRRDAGAELEAERDAVAAIGLAGERMRWRRLRHEGSAEFLVVPKSAGREHDALAGPDDDVAVPLPQPRAGDAVPIADELDHGSSEQGRHAALFQAIE